MRPTTENAQSLGLPDTQRDPRLLAFEGYLRSFLKGNPMMRSAWLHTPVIDVYVRISHRVVGSNLYHFLDIANVTVPSAMRNQRIFANALAIAQDLTPKDGVFIENVHSPILRAYLLRLQQQDDRWVTRGQDFAWLKRP